MANDQLEAFKREINLAEFAASRGYALIRHESSRNSAVMKNDAGDKIVVARNTNGHWIYFSVHDSNDNGTILDFVIHREGGGNFGRARRVIAAWSGYTLEPDMRQHRIAFDLQPSSKDRQQVVANWARMRDIEEHPYLAARGLVGAVTADPRFCGTLRIDARRNAVFPHHDQDGLCGYEVKNRGFTGFAPGGEKGLWRSNPKEGDAALIIAESAIDAMSYFAVAAREGLYISTAGAWAPRTGDLILAEMDRLPRESELVLAFDNDEQGGGYVRQAMALLAGRGHLIVLAQPPSPHKDWNDVLQAMGKEALSNRMPLDGVRMRQKRRE
jgi:hypothetical protein